MNLSDYVSFQQAQDRRLGALLSMPREEAEAWFERTGVILARCDELTWASTNGVPVNYKALQTMDPQACINCTKVFVNDAFSVCTNCRSIDDVVGDPGDTHTEAHALVHEDIRF